MGWGRGLETQAMSAHLSLHDTAATYPGTDEQIANDAIAIPARRERVPMSGWLGSFVVAVVLGLAAYFVLAYLW